MALIRLNNQSLTAVTSAGIPVTSGSVLKVQTNPITQFGDLVLANTHTDLFGTEHSFTRTKSNSKILVTFNLKMSSLYNAIICINRKIGSGSYAIVNTGATGTNNGRTSQGTGYTGQIFNSVSENAMGYGIHAQSYTFLDETGEGLTDTADAITYKITGLSGGGGGADKLYLNISGYNGANYNYTTESSVTFMEIAG